VLAGKGPIFWGGPGGQTHSKLCSKWEAQSMSEEEIDERSGKGTGVIFQRDAVEVGVSNGLLKLSRA